MKKMQLKDLNVKSFITAKVKGGELPYWHTLFPTCDSNLICTITFDGSCDPVCK